MAIIVVDTTTQSIAAKNDFSLIAYDSILPTSAYTGQNEDSDFTFLNALDYRDNTKYSPSIDSGTITILFTQSSVETINYFAFAVHNSQDAGLSGMLEVDSGLGYEVVSEFASLRNNKPFISYFGQDLESAKQRLTLNFTSKLYIGSINMGKAIVMPRTPSIGFQPSKFASLDTVEQFTTEGNNFLVGRREKKGNQAKANFRFIKFDYLDEWWSGFSDHVLDSKPIYFKWSKNKDETIYGLQNWKSLTKPTYSSSLYADISLEINGYI